MKLAAYIFVAFLVLAGCKRDEMSDQPKARPLRATEFFEDGSTARPIVPGTIARGQSLAPPVADTAAAFPFLLSYDDLKRGQERFDIYCAVCHGRTGEGNGIIVQRGFTQPPAYFPIAEHRSQHPDLFAREQALMAAPPGHFVNVISNGFGAMYSYADRVNADDRWRIAGYIKAIQLSRTMKASDLSASDRAAVESARLEASPATQPTEVR